MSIPLFFGEKLKPLCTLCGTRHESYQGHVFATNAQLATNRIATNADATNKTETDSLGDAATQLRSGSRVHSRPQDGQADGQGEAGSGRGVVVAPVTKNRRTREVYNRYQRDYMRKYRARIPS